MRTCLDLPYMLGIDVISFSINMYMVFFCLIFQQKRKKKIGEKMRNFYFFSFDSFSDITCVFA
jgi:hypothetical protein